ncbi:MAG: hypothetical protein IH957_03570 [Chloroflexi bacterium]|nr:hypothetical protein [Chloroflexota bacterium]
MALRQELDGLYIPNDERDLALIQRRADRLEKKVRTWARSVVRVLPRGLSMLEDETQILTLFLAQQHRVNLELDAQYPNTSIAGTLARILPFVEGPDDPDTVLAIHPIVTTQLDSDLERACAHFCNDRGVEPMSDAAIEWRAAIRYLGQSIYHIASEVGDVKRQFADSPRRFELALISRDLASEIVDRRSTMLAAFRPSAV